MHGPSRKSICAFQVLYRQRYECAACSKLLPPDYEIDHKLPVALGGSNALVNLQALCKPCHADKTRSQRREILDVISSAAAASASTSSAPPAVAKAAAAAAGPAAVVAPVAPARKKGTLNPQQRAAVKCVTGPVRVVATAGAAQRSLSLSLSLEETTHATPREVERFFLFFSKKKKTHTQHHARHGGRFWPFSDSSRQHTRTD